MGINLTEANTGYRAYSRKFLELAPWKKNGDGYIFDPQCIIQAKHFGLNIEEVPVFTCQSSDVSAATFNDTFVIDSVTYYIKEIFPDGTGMTRFTLSG